MSFFKILAVCLREVVETAVCDLGRVGTAFVIGVRGGIGKRGLKGAEPDVLVSSDTPAWASYNLLSAVLRGYWQYDCFVVETVQSGVYRARRI